MPVVMSAGQMENLAPAWTPTLVWGSMRLYNDYYRDYAALYREQPNVRVCVDFLARNVAQLGLHVFKRVSDTDRQRLVDHPLARVLKQPLPAKYKISRYRLIESVMSDLGIYFNAYWLKLRTNGLPGLLRIPPDLVTVRGGMVINDYEVNVGGTLLRFEAEEVVHFRGYNPESALIGLSPLETLRRILAEEHAAGDYREHFWQNAARMGGIIERPDSAPEWSDAARERFKSEFEALYSGGDNSGKTAILEEGMTWRPGTFNPQESEYLGGRKLTREECARAYHIPLPMVGILDHATYSNIEAQHKHLYQDCLAPWLVMIESDIEMQLLPDLADSDVYVEFNIQEKLSGSFEEQSRAFQAAVGRPWMTPNEARARMNLTSLEGDADRIATPLNVLIGGQASPRGSAPPPKALTVARKAAGLDSWRPVLRQRHEERWAEALASHYRRQEAAVLSRVPKRAKVDLGGLWFDEDRWNDELNRDLLLLNVLTATTWAQDLAEQIGIELSEQRMEPWLREHSRIQAEYLNSQVREELTIALAEPEQREAIKTLFLAAITVWAWRQARAGVLSASTFGAAEAARAGGLKTKTWQTNSANPRESHAALNGVTVGLGELFPNGMRWPGDPTGGAAEVANCQCSVVFGR